VRAVRALATRAYGTATAEAVERVSYAVIDLPQAVLRRHMRAGMLGAGTAEMLAPAARALVSDVPMPVQSRTSVRRKQGRERIKYYSVAEITVTDRGWVRDYVTDVTAMVERRGGRYLARTPRFEKIEGVRPKAQVFLIIEWPSKEAAEAFYDSDGYRPYRQRRIAGAENEFVLVAGEDANHVARMGTDA
jgi:uncharacterized protein (DUF1330 family)